MKNIIVREARPEDLAYIVVHLPDLCSASLHYIPMEEETLPLSAIIGPTRPRFPLSEITVNSHCLIAESQDEIIGILTCRGGRYAETRHITVVEVFIGPDWMNQDIESRLMQEAIAWARETGVVKRLETRILSTCDRTIDLYKKLGFEVEAICRETALIEDRFVDVVIMGLLL